MAAAPSVDIPRPQVTGREVAAAYTEKPKAAVTIVTQAEIDAIKVIQQEKAKSGGRHAAVELARQNLDEQQEKKQWAGAKGIEVAAQFRKAEFQPEVQTRIIAINSARQALEIINLPKAAQDARFAELQASGLVEAGVANSDALINQACAVLASDAALTVCFPDIADSRMTTAQKAEWIKAGIAKDPVLRARLSEAMGNWQERVLKFSDVPETKGTQLADRRTGIDTKRTTSKTSLDALTTSAIAGAAVGVDQRAALEVALENGNPQDVISVIAEIKGITPTELQTITQYNKDQISLEQMRKDIREGRLSKQTATVKAELARLEGLVAPAKMAEYQNVANAVNTTTFKNQLDSYRQSSSDLKNIDIEIAANKPSDSEKAAQFRRESEERAALNELDSVISKAMYDTYSAQEDSIIEGKQAQTEAAMKKALEDGKLDEAKMYTARAKNWIEKAGNGNPEKVHLNAIKTDLNYIRQYGEAGIHVQIARDSGIIVDATAYTIGATTKTGTELQTAMSDGSMSAQEILAFLKSDAATATRLTALTSKDGIVADYRDNLMLSYTRARRYLKMGGLGRKISFGGKTIEIDDGGEGLAGGKFAEFFGSTHAFDLRPNEWADLFDQFGNDIEAGIKKDKAGLQFYERMKGMGVANEKTLKMWMYLLVLLGMVALPLGGIGAAAGAGLGALGGVPGIGAAIGAGSGLGIGGAVASKKSELIQ